MKKIPTLFLRDLSGDGRYVTSTVTPGCEWVIAGEGRATRKYDGTCVWISRDNVLWGIDVFTRREVKPGKVAPPGFVTVETDPLTGATVGWEPYHQSPFTKMIDEALEDHPALPGTYELIGPRINGNREKVESHRLVAHSTAQPIKLTRGLTYEGLRGELTGWIAERGWEGIVWHHRTGAMCKLKVRDFPAS